MDHEELGESAFRQPCVGHECFSDVCGLATFVRRRTRRYRRRRTEEMVLASSPIGGPTEGGRGVWTFAWHGEDVMWRRKDSPREFDNQRDGETGHDGPGRAVFASGRLTHEASQFYDAGLFRAHNGSYRRRSVGGKEPLDVVEAALEGLEAVGSRRSGVRRRRTRQARLVRQAGRKRLGSTSLSEGVVVRRCVGDQVDTRHAFFFKNRLHAPRGLHGLLCRHNVDVACACSKEGNELSRAAPDVEGAGAIAAEDTAINERLGVIGVAGAYNRDEDARTKRDGSETCSHRVAIEERRHGGTYAAEATSWKSETDGALTQ